MEELKLILETVQALGGNATWIAILWLIKGLISEMLVAAGFGVLFFLGYKYGIAALRTCSLGGRVWASMGYESLCQTDERKQEVVSRVEAWVRQEKER